MAVFNFNGQILLEILSEMRHPATLQEIVRVVARQTGLRQNLVEKTVYETLEEGSRLGFVQCLNRTDYFFSPGSNVADVCANIPGPTYRTENLKKMGRIFRVGVLKKNPRISRPCNRRRSCRCHKCK